MFNCDSISLFVYIKYKGVYNHFSYALITLYMIVHEHMVL